MSDHKIVGPSDLSWRRLLCVFYPSYWLTLWEILSSPKALEMYRSWISRKPRPDIGTKLLELAEFFQARADENRAETEAVMGEAKAWREATHELKRMEARYEQLLSAKDEVISELVSERDLLLGKSPSRIGELYRSGNYKKVKLPD